MLARFETAKLDNPSQLDVASDYLRLVKSGQSRRHIAEWLVRSQTLTQFQAQVVAEGNVEQLLIDDYFIRDVIGEGGMGRVYLVNHLLMDRLVALKIMAPCHGCRPELLSRFYREIKTLASLSHPNIVTAFDAGQFQNQPYLVAEYVPGDSLQSKVEREGPLPWRKALSVVHQAAVGLAYAHERGIIHRDIKPANLLIDDYGQVKILDLGIAKILDANCVEQRTQPGVIMGTLGFMSPEQCAGNSVDQRTDIYALGATWYFLVRGESMCEAMQKSTKDCRATGSLRLYDDTDDELGRHEELFHRLIASEPSQRPTSVREFVSTLAGDASLALAISPQFPPFVANQPIPARLWPRKKAAATPWKSLALAYVTLGLALTLMLAISITNFTGEQANSVLKPPRSDERTTAHDDLRWMSEEPVALAFHRDEISSLAFSHRGNDLASGSWDGWLVLWSMPSAKMRWKHQLASSGVLEIAFSEDDQHIFVATDSGSITTLEVESGKQLFHWQAHSDEIHGLVSLPANRLATAGTDRLVKLWDSTNGKVLQTFEAHDQPIASLGFLAERHSLLSADGRGNVNMLPLETSQRQSLFAKVAGVERLAVSRNSQHVATCQGTTLSLYESQTQSLIWSQTASQRRTICDLAFVPDRDALISVGGDGELKVWSVTDGRPIVQSHQRNSEFRRLAVSSGSSLLVAAGASDGTIFLFSRMNAREQHHERRP